MESLVETHSGRVAGSEERGLHRFLGIPYAEAPVGANRFRAPAAAPRWAGVREATRFGDSAPQSPALLPLPGMEVGSTDEDCLYLNVYTPSPDAGRRPVLVWIHGGGFVLGSGSQYIYDASGLVRRGDLVVVTINYRLGALGFLDLRELCPDIDGAVANAGMRDQLAALAWVRDNVAAFGGDPQNVTIFGESAGGMSVATLLGMPAARGHFQRAAPQSGAAHHCHGGEAARKVAETFLEGLGLERAAATRALREIPAKKLVEAQQQMMTQARGDLGLLPFQPQVDDDLIPAPPLDALRAGSAAQVSLLVGTTRDEWKLFGFMDPQAQGVDETNLVERVAAGLPVDRRERADALVDAYRGERQGRHARDARSLYLAIQTDLVFRIPAIRLADAVHAGRGRDASTESFMYRFDWESPGFGGVLGACHGLELPFVWGTLDKPGADQFAGAGPDAEALSGRMMDAWLAFARDGSPRHGGLPVWDPYDPTRRATMVFDRECSAAVDPEAGERRAWDGIV